MMIYLETSVFVAWQIHDASSKSKKKKKTLTANVCGRWE